MLTQILQIRRLLDQPLDLILHHQLLTRSKIPTRQLLLDTRQHLQRARVLHLFGFRVVGNGRLLKGRGTPRAERLRAVAHQGGVGALEGSIGVVWVWTKVCGGSRGRADDGGAAFGWEGGFRW